MRERSEVARARVSNVSIRDKDFEMTYIAPKKKKAFGERLARNCALAGMLLLCVAAIRDASLPSGQTVLTATQDMITMPWDERLGKISFVSNLVPETLAVFFSDNPSIALTAPCIGTVSHAWSGDEPYLGYQSDGPVYAAAEGQVMSVAHGNDEERILRLRHEGGIETLYYNLSQVYVAQGDRVTADTALGTPLPGQEIAVEVRRNGLPIDPSGLMALRSASK